VPPPHLGREVADADRLVVGADCELGVVEWGCDESQAASMRTSTTARVISFTGNRRGPALRRVAVVVMLLRTEVNEPVFSCVLDELGSGVEAQLALNVRAVRFGGAQADVAQWGDVGVRVAEHEQPQHPFLLRRKSVRRVRASSHGARP
jgi:hypothetical protein